MKQMLSDIKVLDLTTTVAGAGAAAMLADYGALVVKVEGPDGDPLRKMPPFLEGESLVHCWFNRGKQSVVLDLETERDVAVLGQMMNGADVVVEDFKPGYLAQKGLGYDAVSAANPGLIYCSVTPFGQTGPYRDKEGNDLMSQALSGVMEITGEMDGPPEKHGTPVGDYAASQSAYSAIVAALCLRLKTGEGQAIDVSTMRNLIWLNSAVDRINVNVYTTREGNHHPALSPFGLFYGNNGQSVIICGLNAKIWSSLCHIIGHPEYIDDPRYSTVSQRTANRFEVVEMLETWLKTFDNIQDAIKLLEEGNVPSCQVYGAKEVFSDPHYTDAQVGWLVQAPTPTSLQAKGKATYLTHSTNAKFSKTPGKIGQAPDLGEHDSAVTAQLGLRE
ncbi:hypothetical protein B5F94_09930 [Flavonifractor sp. An4]|nr:hypothetical protein B5F94_09930 [Flavonifractor sp. An4]